MIVLDLTEEEREIIKEVLEIAHSDLRMEIADTDRAAFRTMLKTRRDIVAKMIEALEPAAELTT